MVVGHLDVPVTFIDGEPLRCAGHSYYLDFFWNSQDRMIYAVWTMLTVNGGQDTDQDRNHDPPVWGRTRESKRSGRETSMVSDGESGAIH